jgi:hypothetical protein
LHVVLDKSQHAQEQRALAEEISQGPLPLHPDFIHQGQSLNGASFTDLKQLQEHIDTCIAAYKKTAQQFA